MQTIELLSCSIVHVILTNVTEFDSKYLVEFLNNTEELTI